MIRNGCNSVNADMDSREVDNAKGANVRAEWDPLPSVCGAPDPPVPERLHLR